jgi:hypothetical protein
MVYGVWCMVYGVWCMVYGVVYLHHHAHQLPMGASVFGSSRTLALL